MEYSEVSLKAAAITGGVLGFLCSLFAVGYGFGMVPMYSMMRYTMVGNAYADFGLVSIIVLTVYGAIIGALIALVYNAALKMK